MQDDSSSRQGPPSLSCVSPSILHLDSHFLVLDKPNDVRMDGDHPVTVERLLGFWHEQHRLCLPQKENSSSSCSHTLFPLTPPPFKWVHQLDYATSGALCVALSRDGAAAACASFQQRRVKKQYLSVLYGHLTVNSLTQFCVKPQIFDLYEGEEGTQKLVDSIRGSNGAYYSLRKETQRGLSQKFQSDDTWQSQLMLKNLRLAFSALKEFLACYTTEESLRGLLEERKNDEEESVRKKTRLEDDFSSLLSDYRDFQNISFEELSVNHKQRKVLRKFLSKCGVIYEIISEENFKKDFFKDKVKDEENKESTQNIANNSIPLPLDDLQIESILHFYRSQSENNNEKPNIYRIPSNSTSIYSSDETHGQKNEENQFLIIDLPLADYDTNEFKVIPGLHPSLRPQYNAFLVENKDKYDSLDQGKLYFPEGKRSLTKLEVIATGYFNGDIPVTKVLLTPLTGRRHQLRLHCRSIGFPILNDFTYNKLQLKNNHYTSKRMALHSFRLTIYPSTKISEGLKKFLLEKQVEESDSKDEKNEHLNLERPYISVETVDPFIFVDNQLKI